LNLKNNVFGFEVDSGKDDMVKGLVGINLAGAAMPSTR
jgi:hypothetical protein